MDAAAAAAPTPAPAPAAVPEVATPAATAVPAAAKKVATRVVIIKKDGDDGARLSLETGQYTFGRFLSPLEFLLI